MKKLGTPIGAGPGRESEKVGLLGDGTPLPEGRFDAGLLGFLLWALFGAGLAVVCGCWVCGCDDDCWLWPLDDGAGVVDE